MKDVNFSEQLSIFCLDTNFISRMERILLIISVIVAIRIGKLNDIYLYARINCIKLPR